MLSHKKHLLVAGIFIVLILGTFFGKRVLADWIFDADAPTCGNSPILPVGFEPIFHSAGYNVTVTFTAKDDYGIAAISSVTTPPCGNFNFVSTPPQSSTTTLQQSYNWTNTNNCPHETYTFTFTATDNNGNQQTCTGNYTIAGVAAWVKTSGGDVHENQ